MRCPRCNKEMENGKGLFMSMQGMGQMMLIFTPKSESNKGFFNSKTKEKIIMPAEETDSYYCAECNLLLPILKC
ncbi:MAG: PF20097 family protein [Oscillospiraceae bacterium]|nr:PF20097 family protein [Oscillospiraceae bacterium]